jgi:hypothetical protein
VTREVAREICQRTQSKAVLAGSIATLGSHYAIDLKAENCQTGDSLGSAEAEADSREKVLEALGKAATTLRARLGESLATITRFDKPLEEATTSSLEALKAYTAPSPRTIARYCTLEEYRDPPGRGDVAERR